MTGLDGVVPAKVRIPHLVAVERSRVITLLSSVWSSPLSLVVAPAGCGKTTALAQFAATAAAEGHPVAWYHAEDTEGEVPALLRHLQESIGASASPAARWDSVGRAAQALEAWPASGADAVLIIDDLHVLEATPAERALEQLVGYLPPNVHVLAASRRPPGFNLPLLRVSQLVHQLGPDDLRFRPWEIERLFRDHYRDPLRPDDMAELARRTEGWAAALQLFHLATRGKTPAERRRVLDSLSTRLRLVREYLARNVLAGLDEELRRFLVHSSVLGLLSGPLCDALLERQESHRILAEIERRNIFLSTSDDGATWRYHEVLRSHLVEILVEEVGEAGAQVQHRRAGELLEAEGHATEALEAYCRAEDWVAVERLLASRGDQMSEDLGDWIHLLPASIAAHDAWVLLAAARRGIQTGHWRRALDNYRRGEDVSGGTLAADICRKERQLLTNWLEPSRPARSDWSAMMRQALSHDPLAMASRPGSGSGPAADFITGLALAVAGHLTEARPWFVGVADDPSASPALTVFAALAAELADQAVVGMASVPSFLAGAHSWLEALDRAGPPWLPRVFQALWMAGPEIAAKELTDARRSMQQEGNQWFAALLGLIQGALLLACPNGSGREQAVAALSGAADTFGQLKAQVLEAWARAALALALTSLSHPEAEAATVAALKLSESTGCPGAEALAARVGAAFRPTHQTTVTTGVEFERLAESLEAQGAVSLAAAVAWVMGNASPLGDPTTPPKATLRCLGPFSLAINGRTVDPTAVKPRARAVLYLLALHANQAVHRDTLVGALWPNDDDAAATRNLQVAISSVRQLLEPGVERGSASLLVREGDSYRLALGAEGEVDLANFARDLSEARLAKATGDDVRQAGALTRALDRYRGEVLPEAGSAEWVIGLREQLRIQAANAAETLAKLQIAAGNHADGAATCERGLLIDRYCDSLWRLLVDGLEKAGERAASARAARQYREMLADLGIDAVDTTRS